MANATADLVTRSPGNNRLTQGNDTMHSMRGSLIEEKHYLRFSVYAKGSEDATKAMKEAMDPKLKAQERIEKFRKIAQVQQTETSLWKQLLATLGAREVLRATREARVDAATKEVESRSKIDQADITLWGAITDSMNRKAGDAHERTELQKRYMTAIEADRTSHYIEEEIALHLWKCAGGGGHRPLKSEDLREKMRQEIQKFALPLKQTGVQADHAGARKSWMIPQEEYTCFETFITEAFGLLHYLKLKEEDRENFFFSYGPVGDLPLHVVHLLGLSYLCDDTLARIYAKTPPNAEKNFASLPYISDVRLFTHSFILDKSQEGKDKDELRTLEKRELLRPEAKQQAKKYFAKAADQGWMIKRPSLQQPDLYAMSDDMDTLGFFSGETVLHIAIANRRTRVVERLLNHPFNADIRARTTGVFFSPPRIMPYATAKRGGKTGLDEEKKGGATKLPEETVQTVRGQDKKEDSQDAGNGKRYPYHKLMQDASLWRTWWGRGSALLANKDSVFYGGELPLSFAASVGDLEIMELLMAKARDPFAEQGHRIEQEQPDTHKIEAAEQRGAEEGGGRGRGVAQASLEEEEDRGAGQRGPDEAAAREERLVGQVREELLKRGSGEVRSEEIARALVSKGGVKDVSELREVAGWTEGELAALSLSVLNLRQLRAALNIPAPKPASSPMPGTRASPPQLLPQAEERGGAADKRGSREVLRRSFSTSVSGSDPRSEPEHESDLAAAAAPQLRAAPPPSPEVPAGRVGGGPSLPSLPPIWDMRATPPPTSQIVIGRALGNGNVDGIEQEEAVGSGNGRARTGAEAQRSGRRPEEGMNDPILHNPAALNLEQKAAAEFINKQDSFGNTALHLAVFHNQTDAFDWIMKHGGEQSLTRLNAFGLTPFTLAASEGRAPMFLHILKTHLSMMLWKYGPVSCYYRNLAQLDTFRIAKFKSKPSVLKRASSFFQKSLAGTEDEHKTAAIDAAEMKNDGDEFLESWGKKPGDEETAKEAPGIDPERQKLHAAAEMHSDKSWRSALEIIILQRIDEIMENRDVSVLVKKIIKKKWQQFGKRMHLVTRVIPYMVLVAFYTTMMVLRSQVLHDRKWADAAGLPWDTLKDPYPAATLVFEILVLAFLPILAWFAKNNLHLNINDLDINMDGKTSTHERVLFIYKNVPAMLDFLIIAGVVLVAILRAAGQTHYEINGLAMTGVLVWCNVLSVLAPYQFFGALVITIHKMLVGDVAKFLVIYIVLVTGFGLGLFLLLQNGIFPLDEAEQELVRCVNCDTYLGTMILKLVWVSVGEADQTELLNLTSSPNLAYGMHLVYVILSLVLLLNLIIAMMGDTYHRQFEDVEKEWFFPHAALVLKYEKWLSEEEKIKFRLGFSTSFAGSTAKKSQSGETMIKRIRRMSTTSVTMDDPMPEAQGGRAGGGVQAETKDEEPETDGQTFHWFQDLLRDGDSEVDEVIRL